MVGTREVRLVRTVRMVRWGRVVRMGGVGRVGTTGMAWKVTRDRGSTSSGWTRREGKLRKRMKSRASSRAPASDRFALLSSEMAYWGVEVHWRVKEIKGDAGRGRIGGRVDV